MMPAQQIDIQVIYDDDFDVLYVNLGDRAPSESFPLNGFHGVYIKRDVYTEKITGYVIEDYSRQDIHLLNKLLPIPIPEDKLPQEI